MLRHSAGAFCSPRPGLSRTRPAAARRPQKPAAPADQKPATQPTPETQQTPEESPVYKEQVVVTASKTEQALVNAPATVSLITSQTIAEQRLHQLRRPVPRGARRQRHADLGARHQHHQPRRHLTLSTSQLALVDGRSIYLDFFGFVAWDFLPVNPGEIKQIEVIRGPASAIWGANAMNGVVNVITKSPRELQGSSVTIGVGGFGRETSNRSEGAGALFYVNGSHAQAVNDRWAYKFSAGVYTQDPLARPTGAIPNGTGTQYPTFTNQGTTQPKVDVRVDYDFEDGKQKLVFQGGVAGTDGILHSGIGPFDIDQGTVLGYGKVNYSKDAMKLNFFTEHPQRRRDEPAGRGSRRASRCCSTSRARPTTSSSATCGRSSSGTSSATAATSATATSTCRLRRPATNAHGRRRLRAGRDLPRQVRPLAARRARRQVRHHRRRAVLAADDADAQAVGGADVPRVVQPRVPRAVGDQQLPRHDDHQPVAARRDQPGACRPGLQLPDPRRRQQRRPAAGDSSAGSGRARRSPRTRSATPASSSSAPRSRRPSTSTTRRDDVFFTQVASYRATNPPPGWPPPPIPPFLGGIILEVLFCPPGTTPSAARPCPFGVGNGLPAAFSYRNFGKVQQKGLELGIDGAFNKEWSAFANYSYQPEPKPTGFPTSPS